MVEGKTVFVCDICGLGYRERETAERCQDYCAAHRSCSLEIMKEAVYFPSKPET